MTLALGVLAVPAAQACDFAGPGPDLPARIWVWDLEEATVIDQVDLWSRGLDGDCGLNKAHDLEGDRLAYADRAGDSMGVWIHGLGNDAPPRLVFRLDGHYRDLDLDGDRLYIYMQTTHHTPDVPEPRNHQHVFTVDLESGEARRLPLEVDWLGNPRIEDGRIAWDWVSRDDYHHRLNVFDLANDAWVHQNVSYANAFSVEDGRLHHVNADWLVFTGDRHMMIHRDGITQPLPEDLGHPTALDGDLLYVAGHDRSLTEHTLPEMQEKTYPALGHPVFRESAFDDGRVVLGAYSVDGPHRPPSWIRDPALAQDHPLPPEWVHNEGDDLPWFLQAPAPGVTHIGGVLLVALALLRLRSGRA